jgi:multiple sugar transport system permease protein
MSVITEPPPPPAPPPDAAPPPPPAPPGGSEPPAHRGPAKRRTRLESERRLAYILVAPAVVVMFAVAGYPILYAFYLSLRRYDLRFPSQAKFVGLSNYATVLSSSVWWKAFENTAVIAVVSVVIELALGMAIALVMHRAIFARGAVRTVILIPYGIVTVVAAISWSDAWTPHLGWINHYIVGDTSAPLTHHASAMAVIILSEVWKTTPFMSLLLLSGLVLVPNDLIEAAKVDGASAWQRFTKVMLPIMKPAILVALLFRTLDAVRVFDNIYILTNGAANTESVSIVGYNQLFEGLNVGIGSAVSILIFLLVIVIAFLFVKGFGTATPGSQKAQ